MLQVVIRLNEHWSNLTHLFSELEEKFVKVV
jgi:hypothetical protein